MSVRKFEIKPDTISVWKSLKKKRMSLLGANSITLDCEKEMTEDEEREFNETKVYKEM